MGFLCSGIFADLANEFGEDVVVLAMSIVVVTILIAIMTVAARIARIRVIYLYWFANRHTSSGGYTGESAARKALDELGFTDIQVRKAGIFRTMIFGNHYNRFTKTIWLRRSTMYGDNLTSVGLAVQKVGLVMQDKREEKAFRTRSLLQMIGVFGPILFIPLVIVGVIIDIATGFTKIPSLALLGVGLAFFICSFVFTMLNIPVEKKANKEALEFLQGSDMLTEDEQHEVAKVLRGYLIAYVIDFIINVLKLIQLILKIVLQVALSKKNN